MIANDPRFVATCAKKNPTWESQGGSTNQCFRPPTPGSYLPPLGSCLPPPGSYLPPPPGQPKRLQDRLQEPPTSARASIFIIFRLIFSCLFMFWFVICWWIPRIVCNLSKQHAMVSPNSGRRHGASARKSAAVGPQAYERRVLGTSAEKLTH